MAIVKTEHLEYPGQKLMLHLTTDEEGFSFIVIDDLDSVIAIDIEMLGQVRKALSNLSLAAEEAHVYGEVTDEEL